MWQVAFAVCKIPFPLRRSTGLRRPEVIFFSLARAFLSRCQHYRKRESQHDVSGCDATAGG